VLGSHLVPVDVDGVDAVTNVVVDAADVVVVVAAVAVVASVAVVMAAVVVVAAGHRIDPDQSCHCWSLV